MSFKEADKKLLAWYDNEAAYTARCLDLMAYLSKIDG